MIKAFLFDYDGVMTLGVKDGALSERLAHNTGMDREKASELMASIWQDFSVGKMTEQEVWHRIEAQYGQPITSEQRDIWFKWEELRPLAAMTDLVHSLKAKGYAVGLLSNVIPHTADIIREHGGYDSFDFCILSYEAGARKPDPKIYESALSHVPGAAPEEVVFLDDREPCVIGAKALGIHAIHVTDHERAIQQVNELLDQKS